VLTELPAVQQQAKQQQVQKQIDRLEAYAPKFEQVQTKLQDISNSFNK